MAAQQLAISTTAGNGGKKFTVVAPKNTRPNNSDQVIVDKEAFK